MTAAATAAGFPRSGPPRRISPCPPRPGATSRSPAAGEERAAGVLPPRVHPGLHHRDVLVHRGLRRLPRREHRGAADQRGLDPDAPRVQGQGADLGGSAERFQAGGEPPVRHAAGGPVPLQPRLHPDRPGRHRALDLRRRDDPATAGRTPSCSSGSARSASPSTTQGSRCVRLLLAALCLGATAGRACRIEDHTPAGTRRDEDAVQEIVARYAPRPERRDWDQRPGALLAQRDVLRTT